MAEINIDTYLCSGCATCEEMCPQVFRMNPESEKAELVSLNPIVTDEVYLVAAYCPEKCIEIKE